MNRFYLRYAGRAETQGEVYEIVDRQIDAVLNVPHAPAPYDVLAHKVREMNEREAKGEQQKRYEDAPLVACAALTAYPAIGSVLSAREIDAMRDEHKGLFELADMGYGFYRVTGYTELGPNEACYDASLGASSGRMVRWDYANDRPDLSTLSDQDLQAFTASVSAELHARSMRIAQDIEAKRRERLDCAISGRSVWTQ